MWTCAIDGAQWPCTPARLALTAAYGRGSAELAAHLAALMAIAEQELVTLDRAGLYRRFLAWTRADGELCRVCGRRGHAVLPGLPPRLVPCEEVRELMPTGGSAAGER